MLRKDLCCFSEPLENHGKSKKGNLLLQIALHFRGDKGNRTPDLLTASQTL